MPVATELRLRLPNSPGAIADVCRVLTAERVNIQALSLEASGQLRLVVDNVIRAQAALREQRYVVTTGDVLVVSLSHRPGGLSPVLQLVADAGINVEYAYGAAGDSSPRALAVLGVDDAARAAAIAGL